MDHKEGSVPFLKHLMLLNCSTGEGSCESLGLPGTKGNQYWIFIGRTDAEAETPILRPYDTKNQLIGKDPDAGKDWRWEEKGTTEDETVGWHHQLDGHDLEQAPGVGVPWSRKEVDMSEQLNWTDWYTYSFNTGASSCSSSVTNIKQNQYKF